MHGGRLKSLQGWSHRGRFAGPEEQRSFGLMTGQATTLMSAKLLAALGVTFVLATSTDEALERLKIQSFDAIISDMGRPPDSQAGYTLLDRLRAGGDQTPFIIYAGSRAPEHRAEARRRGAVGCTNRPDELFEMVLSVLGQGREPN